MSPCNSTETHETTCCLQPNSCTHLCECVHVWQSSYLDFKSTARKRLHQSRWERVKYDTDAQFPVSVMVMLECFFFFNSTDSRTDSGPSRRLSGKQSWRLTAGCLPAGLPPALSTTLSSSKRALNGSIHLHISACIVRLHVALPDTGPFIH